MKPGDIIVMTRMDNFKFRQPLYAVYEPNVDYRLPYRILCGSYGNTNIHAVRRGSRYSLDGPPTAGVQWRIVEPDELDKVCTAVAAEALLA